MREIKFRAWVDYEKAFEEKGEDFMEYDLGVWGKEECVILSDNSEIGFDDCVLMQFTGLKDKNGKEIYEGDILRIKFTDCESDKEIFIFLKCIFEEGKFILKDYNDGTYLFEDEIVEVIGNIYENLELLEKSK